MLASVSPHRKRLLRRLRVPFLCAAPICDEAQIPGEPCAARALRLAEEKTLSVANKRPAATVLGGDQTISGGGIIFDKPGDRKRAIAQLQMMSGKTLTFHTALAISSGGTLQCALTTHRAKMRALTKAEIARYVAAEPSYNCAGGAQLEGLGISLMQSIEGGDPTALTGMPLITVAQFLRARGFLIP